MRRSRPLTCLRRAGAFALALGLGLGGCSEQSGEGPAPSPPSSFHARGALGHPAMLEALRADAERPRNPGDGGGRAWLTSAAVHRVGESSRFDLVYEAGEHGIAVDGFVLLQISPYWGWSEPQIRDPASAGFTTASTDAAGVTLTPDPRGNYLLGFRIGGRALAAGEQVQISYGAGPAGAVVDRYAERGTRIWLAVDADGDGALTVLPDSPQVEVRPGPAAQMLVSLPGTARPGETVELVVAAVDAIGNAGAELAGELRLGPVAGLRLPERVPLGPGGTARIPVVAEAAGTFRIDVYGPGGLGSTTNPLRVSATEPRILFGDLHGHSHYSDGTGTPEDWFRYARDVAGLDFAALTDHDHWGIPSLDARPDLWEDIQKQVTRFHAPRAFVTMLGFEWTSWVYGHRHVLRFADRGPLLSWVARETETPEQLWDELRGQDVLTFAHHSAGGPVATDWSIAPDPLLEPVTEIVSGHGSSEAPDTPFPIEAAAPRNTVRDALGYGYRLGFVGSGDSHDGHPGLQRPGLSGGLAAVIAEDLTRASLLEALRSRRCYATNGPRILLTTTLGGQPMGATVATSALPAEVPLSVEVVSPRPIERVEIVRGESVVPIAIEAGQEALTLTHPVARPAPGETLYVRVVVARDGAAWSSPYFFD